VNDSPELLSHMAKEFSSKPFLQSNCFRYHHDRCKGKKGCECWCHTTREEMGIER